MTDTELKYIVRSIKALSRRADVAARKLQAHRTHGVMVAADTSMMGLVQLSTVCRDFASNAEGAFAALSPELKRQCGIKATT